MGSRAVIFSNNRPLMGAELEREFENVRRRINDIAYNVVDFGADRYGNRVSTIPMKAAFAQASAEGAWLWFPDGTYLIDDNITDFHTVKKFGAGQVKFGTTTFYITPKFNERNTFYVATTGSDTNMGIDSTNACATPQQIVDHLANYGPIIRGEVQINIAAGTYTGADAEVAWPDRLRTEGVTTASSAVRWIGADVSGTPNTPTTIMDGTGSSGNGWIFDHGSAHLVNDIKFQDFTSTAITAQYSVRLICNNVHLDNNGTGLEGRYSTTLDFDGGKITSNTMGVQVIGGVNFDFDSDSSNLAGGTEFSGNTTGIQIQESCHGHLDYCTIDNNTTGVVVQMESRVRINDGDVKNNTTGAQVQNGSSLSFNTGTDWNEGGASRNTTKYVLGSYGSKQGGTAGLRMAPIGDRNNTFAKVDSSTGATNGVASTLLSSILSIEEDRCAGITNRAAYGTIFGAVSGTGTKKFDILLDGTSMASATTASGAAADYVFKWWIRLGDGAQKNCVQLDLNGTAPIVTYASTSIDLSTASTHTISLDITLSDVTTGSVTHQFSEVWETG